MSVETRGPRAASKARKPSARTNPADRARKATQRAHTAARAAIAAMERAAPPEHDHEAAFIDGDAIPKERLDVMAVENAAQAVFNVHEALKGLTEVLYQAGRGKHVGCLKMYCVLELMDRELFSALDLLRAYSPLIPDEG